MQGELTRKRAGAELTVWLEAICKGLGCDTGSRTIELRFDGGKYKTGFLHHGPINEHELNAIVRVARTASRDRLASQMNDARGPR